MFNSRKAATAAVAVGLVSAAIGCNQDGNLPPCTPAATGSSAVVADQGQFLETPTPISAGQPLKHLHGHVMAAVKQASDLGKVDDAQEIPLTFSMPLNNSAALDQEIAAIYQVGNSHYHQFLTSQEFHEKYAPTQEQIGQVQSYLEQQGMTSVTVDDNGLLVHAISSVGVINSTFHTEIHQYHDVTGDQTFRSPAYELQTPEGVPIVGVHGLQDLTRFRTHLVQSQDTAEKPHMGTGPGGGLSPADIRAAYNLSESSSAGAGQTLALFELDSYTARDIAEYEQVFGLPNVPLQNVMVAGATGVPGTGAGEVTLDIELMIALAPGAQKIIVYEGPNSDQGVLSTYSQIASDNTAKSISTSWGEPETEVPASLLQSEYNVFAQMAAQGQTIFAAAGDSGAYDNGTQLGVDDPASQPYVVGVGGTELSTGNGETYAGETTWDGGNSKAGAGGGGISSVWTIPSYQSGLVSTQSKGSTTMRNVPDVSLNADPATGYAIAFNGNWTIYGGTSCAAPLWAAFAAIVNQERAQNGLGTLGYMNPLLYQIGKGSNYHSDFNDVSDGSTNLFYPAVSGYDDATGWGSFNGNDLLNDLSKQASVTVTTSGGLFGGGTSGSNFAPTCQLPSG